MIKKISGYVILLIAGLSIGHLITPKRDKAYEDRLEAEVLQYKKVIIGLESSKRRLLDERDILKKKYALTTDSLVYSKATTAKWHKEYVSIKKISVPRNLSDRELDSLVTGLVTKY